MAVISNDGESNDDMNEGIFNGDFKINKYVYNGYDGYFDEEIEIKLDIMMKKQIKKEIKFVLDLLIKGKMKIIMVLLMDIWLEEMVEFKLVNMLDVIMVNI